MDGCILVGKSWEEDTNPYPESSYQTTFTPAKEHREASSFRRREAFHWKIFLDPSKCHHLCLLKLFPFWLWPLYNEVIKLSSSKVRTNRCCPPAPLSSSDSLLTEPSYSYLMFTLQLNIEQASSLNCPQWFLVAFPPEVTYNSELISTLGTGGQNCSFWDLLPCICPLGVSFATLGSNYSARCALLRFLSPQPSPEQLRSPDHGFCWCQQWGHSLQNCSPPEVRLPLGGKPPSCRGPKVANQEAVCPWWSAVIRREGSQQETEPNLSLLALECGEQNAPSCTLPLSLPTGWFLDLAGWALAESWRRGHSESPRPNWTNWFITKCGPLGPECWRKNRWWRMRDNSQVSFTWRGEGPQPHTSRERGRQVEVGVSDQSLWREVSMRPVAPEILARKSIRPRVASLTSQRSAGA